MSSSIRSVLEEVDARPTPAAYAVAARALSRLFAVEPLRPLRVALVSSFTIDGLVPYVTVESARRGFAVETYLAPFNNVQQELLREDSGLTRFAPNAIFVSQLLEDIAPALAFEFLTLSRDRVETMIEEIADQVVRSVEEFRRRSHSAIFVHNFALPERAVLGIAECNVVESQTEAIRSLNRRLAARMAGVAGSFVFDYDRSCAEVGYRRCRDPRSWHIGRIAISPAHMPHLAADYASLLQAELSRPKKCLAVDLDNTLWGGVLGEDGAAALQIGQVFPGNAYRAFQQALLDLRRRGVILAAVSKNDHDEAMAVLRDHPDMLLRPRDFSASRINWQDKPQNIREIAAELNIGLDSIVFFDDNPAERALMREALPEVTTLEAPADPAGYTRCLLDSRCFDQLSYSEEDWHRGDMYRAQAEREQFRTSSGTLLDFYAGLEMHAAIEPVNDWTMDRVHALLHKTNQFNVTTRRHSQGALQAMRTDPNFTVLTVKLTDRFGDNGVIGAAILEVQDDRAVIDSLLLSCRVIGRTVETAVLSRLCETARECGCRTMQGGFIPTKKNRPAADLFERHGFRRAAADEDGSQIWLLDLEEQRVEWPSYIERERTEVASHV
jgi:FkbH-like protein